MILSSPSKNTPSTPAQVARHPLILGENTSAYSLLATPASSTCSCAAVARTLKHSPLLGFAFLHHIIVPHGHLPLYSLKIHPGHARYPPLPPDVKSTVLIVSEQQERNLISQPMFPFNPKISGTLVPVPFLDENIPLYMVDGTHHLPFLHKHPQ